MFLVVFVFVRSRAVRLTGEVCRPEFFNLIIQLKEFKVTLRIEKCKGVLIRIR